MDGKGDAKGGQGGGKGDGEEGAGRGRLAAGGDIGHVEAGAVLQALDHDCEPVSGGAEGEAVGAGDVEEGRDVEGLVRFML